MAYTSRHRNTSWVQWVLSIIAGTIEYQGRGTLHFHVGLLMDVPDSSIREEVYDDAEPVDNISADDL